MWPACCWCGTKSGISAQTARQIREQLQRISEVFPHTSYACVLDREGNMRMDLYDDQVFDHDVSALASSVKRAVMQFAETLGHQDCSIVHVEGTQCLFSCYEVGDDLLAFYSEMSDSEKEGFDLPTADGNMTGILTQLSHVFESTEVT